MNHMPMDRMVDCLVVGGGPAGLTAAIYLARFRLTTLVVDAGGGRASLIACTHNHAGFPGGISGPDLLDRMRRQALEYGAELASGRVRELATSADGLRASLEDGQSIVARAVLLATGATDRHPDMPGTVLSQALASGRLRYCPVCDGWEVTGQHVAVIGAGRHALKEAEFLTGYARRVTIVPPGPDDDLSAEDRRRLGEIGVEVRPGPAHDFRLEAGAISLRCGEGRARFDSVYPAMGLEVNSGLAAGVGAEIAEDGCVVADDHQRTSVAGLYAAGDLVIGLDQISHAMGQAGVAATTIRNDLAARG